MFYISQWQITFFSIFSSYIPLRNNINTNKNVISIPLTSRLFFLIDWWLTLRNEQEINGVSPTENLRITDHYPSIEKLIISSELHLWKHTMEIIYIQTEKNLPTHLNFRFTSQPCYIRITIPLQIDISI